MSYDHRNRDPLARSPLGDFRNLDDRPISLKWIGVAVLVVFALFASVALLGDRSSQRVAQNTALPPAAEMVPQRPTPPTTPVPAE